MALLRYTLNDGVNKVDLQDSWIEELYYGPVRVVNGYTEVPDNDDISITALCARGFELVKDEAEVHDEPVDEREPEEVETDEDEEDQPIDLEKWEKELRKMSRKELNEKGGHFGVTTDAESFDTKEDLIAAIIAANTVELD